MSTGSEIQVADKNNQKIEQAAAVYTRGRPQTRAPSKIWRQSWRRFEISSDSDNQDTTIIALLFGQSGSDRVTIERFNECVSAKMWQKERCAFFCSFYELLQTELAEIEYRRFVCRPTHCSMPIL